MLNNDLNKRIISKFLICFIILNCINLSAFATNWKEIAHKRYIDYDSYHQITNGLFSNRYAVWEKLLNNGDKHFKDVEKQKGKKVWYSLTRFGVDCNSKMVSVLDVIYYDLSEETLQSNRYSEYTGWNSIVPGSCGEYYYKIMCPSQTNY